jgi:hypothetical protein
MQEEQVKIVLTEVAEEIRLLRKEQQQVALRLEKLEQLYQSLKQQLAEQAVPKAELRLFREALDRFSQQAKKPIRHITRHAVSLNKGAAALAALFLAVVVLVVLLVQTRGNVRQNRASDIKYRYLQQAGGALGRVLRRTDSLYEVNPDGMRQEVLQREHDEQERLELLREAEAKQREAERLKKQAAGKGSR